MIIVDLSQTVIASVNAGLRQDANRMKEYNAPVDEGLILHVIYSSLLNIRKKFSKEFGKMILACDGPNVWRKDFFPYYKAARKKAKEDGVIDYKMVYRVMDKVKKDCAEFMPWPTIQVEGAEGDDVIGVIAGRGDDRTIIVSGDRDMAQLGKTLLVRQWDHVRKEWVLPTYDVVTTENKVKKTETVMMTPWQSVIYKIIKGDTGDGVPNLFSDDDVFVNESKKQKPIKMVDVARWLEMVTDDEDACKAAICGEDEMLRKNWDRNSALVNLKRIPDELVGAILYKYDEQMKKRVTSMDVTNYLMANRMRRLMEDVQYFT